MPRPRNRSGTMARWRPAAKRPGVMNKTEAEFELVLRALQQAGEIVSYQFEPIKFRLGTDWKTTYTPDFLVLRADGQIELIDVKGPAGWEQHTRVKIKAAAAMFPCFHWVGYQKKGKAGFTREEF